MGEYAPSMLYIAFVYKAVSLLQSSLDYQVMSLKQRIYDELLQELLQSQGIVCCYNLKHSGL